MDNFNFFFKQYLDENPPSNKDIKQESQFPRKIKKEYEVDLHGLTEEQAIRTLSSYIDKMKNLSSEAQLRVIHGKGIHSKNNMPVLKRAVRNYLSAHERVRTHRL